MPPRASTRADLPAAQPERTPARPAARRRCAPGARRTFPAGRPARWRWPGRRPAPGAAGRAARRSSPPACSACSWARRRRPARRWPAGGGPAPPCPAPARRARAGRRWHTAAARKLTSNGALCAVSTAPWAKSRKLASAAAGGGAAVTMSSLIPVSATMSGGMARPGLTRVLNSARIWPPLIRTAPISVMPASSGDQPVVSTSTITNSTASKARRPAQGRRSRARAAATQSQRITIITVGPGTDIPPQARRPGGGRVRGYSAFRGKALVVRSAQLSAEAFGAVRQLQLGPAGQVRVGVGQPAHRGQHLGPLARPAW